MRGQRARAGEKWLLMLLLALFSWTAQARMQRVEPGEIPELAPDEGLVVVAVDSDIAIRAVRVFKDGKSFGAGVMKDLIAGRSFQLYIAPTGLYEWRQLQMIYGLNYQLEDDPEFQFKVEAAKITYAGDLLFRPITLWRAQVSVSNRGLAAMDWLQEAHPVLYDKYAFGFSGHYPDPFPAFYREARATRLDAKAAKAVALIAPPAPGALPIPVKTLWKPERIVQGSLNPAGNLLAMHVRDGDDDWGIELVDLQSGTLSVLAKSPYTFSSVEWSGDDTLLLSIGESNAPKMVTVIRIDSDATGRRNYVRIQLPKNGVVVDTLPQDRNHILFGSLSSNGEPMVHRIDISSQQAVDGFRPKARDRLNIGMKGDMAWYADGAGNLRMATVQRENEYVLMHGGAGVFTEVMKLSGDSEFDPVGLSYDGNTIYGLTDEGREQRELVEFDVASRKIGRTLFSRPGVDVVSPIYDSRRNPIGVTYYQGGRLVSEYFEADGKRLAQLLQQAFSGKTVAVVDRSLDGKQMILWVDSGEQPPQIYHLDVEKREASLLGDSMPWLAKLQFAPSEVVSFQGADGLGLEAFLTLPTGPGKRPLVVFPHGGPIGVADRLHFDPEVQFLASLGYGVLQVNFRGSAGYGKAFREAGYRNYGTLIEDDIDAAIRAVVARYPVDEQRMCMVGASYGGYSALVSVIRWPHRFRCAVSVSGVSDRMLFFTASDGGRSEEGRKLLEKIMGNPNTQQAEMQKTSPLYHYREIKVPVMLVHGLEDQRVDYEHTRRMLRMLDMAGNTPVGLEFEKEGHGVDNPDNQEKLWNGVAGFLRQHLGNNAKPAVTIATRP